MKDTVDASITAFKGEVFLWEIIITIVVFASVFYFFNGFKKKKPNRVKKIQI